MDLTTFFNSLILFGSLQGFIIGMLLYRSSQTNQSGKWLACLLLILATACLKIYLNNMGFSSTQIGSLVDAFVPFMIIMAAGPLIYFYVRSELQPESTVTRRDRKHFYPVIIDLFPHAAAIVFFVVLLLGWADPQRNHFAFWFDTYNVYSDIPRWISLSVYLWWSWQLIYRKPNETKNRVAVLPHILQGLKEFLWVFVAFDVLWLLYLIPYTIPRYTDAILNAVDWYPVYLPLVVIIYWLGIRGLLMRRKELTALKKTSSTDLSEEAMHLLIQRLHTTMTEDRLYRDSELNLTRLATHLGLSPKVISVVLNQKLGTSFTEFVNQFRVNEIKERLARQENKKFTITALAFESGFNSQPTFQRAFKNQVGITPSEFLKQIQVES